MRKKGIPRKNGNYIKTCEICGKEFGTVYPGQKTCGAKSCIQKRTEKLQTEKKAKYAPALHKCEICGELTKSKAKIKICKACKEKTHKKYCEFCGAEVKPMRNKKTCDNPKCKEGRRRRNTGWNWKQKQKLANGVKP